MDQSLNIHCLVFIQLAFIQHLLYIIRSMLGTKDRKTWMEERQVLRGGSLKELESNEVPAMPTNDFVK